MATYFDIVREFIREFDILTNKDIYKMTTQELIDFIADIKIDDELMFRLYKFIEMVDSVKVEANIDIFNMKIVDLFEDFKIEDLVILTRYSDTKIKELAGKTLSELKNMTLRELASPRKRND